VLERFPILFIAPVLRGVRRNRGVRIAMPTTLEQIDLWRATPKETQRLEFKEAKNQYDTQKLCAYCVAIANEGGGQLFLGIADHPPRAIVGTSAFPDSNDIAEKLFAWLGFRVDVDAVAHPVGRIVVFHIPSRPRGTAYHHNGKYLMRSGQETVPMSEDQLRKIFAEGQRDWLEEPSQSELTAQAVMHVSGCVAPSRGQRLDDGFHDAGGRPCESRLLRRRVRCSVSIFRRRFA